MTDKPTETDAPALAGSEAQKGGSELDALLGEFDSTAGKSEPKTKAELQRVLADIKPVADYVRSDMEAKARAESGKAIDAAVSAVKGDLKDIPDKVARGWLYERSENQEFLSAFQNRQKNPKAWQAALAEASKDFSTEFKAEDTSKRVASDINAARASVAGATETKGEAPKGPSVIEKARMSDAEWAAYKAERYA